LIAGIGIASAVDVQPSHPSFKWMNEDTNPAVDVPFTNSKAQTYKSSCPACGSRPDVPLIHSQVQEQDAPVAPLEILDAAPQGSSPQESVLPIKPREIPAPDPFVTAAFVPVKCEPRYDGYYCIFYDLSVSGGEPFTPITLWEWDFSDGGPLVYESKRPHVKHKFPGIGDYVVILRVSNEFDTSTYYEVVQVR